MVNSLSAANHNNQMISLINPFTNQQNHQLDDVNLFTGNCKQCRSCFMNLPERQDQACIAIDTSHRQTFLTLTGVELSSTPKSVDFLCLNCANMLKVFSEMGKAAAEMQSRYIEFMQNQIDVVKVEPEEVISLFENNSNDVDDEMKQIYPYEGDAIEIESSDNVAVEMQNCSVQLTRLSSDTIAQYSTFETAQISNKWKCPIDGCNKTCKSKKNLRQHRYQVHQRDSQDESTCNVCGKVCKNKAALWQHQQMHNRKLSCYICSKSFSSKRYLTDHMETYHINNSEFKCTKCSKVCKSQLKLKLHQRSTHDAKKFKCDQCNAAFAAPYLLADHVKVKHEGESFQCSYPGCSKKFSWKRDATAHLRQVHNLNGDEYKKYHKMIKML